MPVLQPEEYDISYFDGKKSTYTHNAGYSKYKRWNRFDNGSADNPKESQGEFFMDIAKELEGANALQSKRFLEIGCAKGFLVQDLNDLGVDAYGIDVSDYAINTAEDSAVISRPDLADKFTVGNALDLLPTYKKGFFNVLFTRWTLECFSDDDLALLIEEMNRVTKNQQIHIIRQSLPTEYYNSKTIEEWLEMPFSSGTILIPNENMQQTHIKT